MSDHLPECPEIVGEVGVSTHCICYRLRACEARVRDDEIAYANLRAASAYAAGVQAARDAVDRMGRYGTDEMEPWDSAIAYTLATIDALRDQPADQTRYNLQDAP